jgi:hypothetical protein
MYKNLGYASLIGLVNVKIYNTMVLEQVEIMKMLL